MVIATEERKITENIPPRIFSETKLEEMAEMLAIPLKVRPWWGVNRGRKRDGSQKWFCSGGINCTQKKYPEIQNGSVILWEGMCRCLNRRRYSYKKARHTHSQDINIIAMSIEMKAMLVAITTHAGTATQFLIGIDEGSPYFVPVGKNIKTIEDAFGWLVPKPVKIAIIKGLSIKRQGDWFFIPSKSGPRRIIHKRYHEFPVHFNYTRGIAYKDIPLIDDNVLTRHRAEEGSYMVSKLLVRGTITAPNHEEIFLEGWHVAVRNIGLQGRDWSSLRVFGDRIVRPDTRAQDD